MKVRHIVRTHSWLDGTVLIGVVIICAFFALLAGDQTRGNRYQPMELLWGKDLLVYSALWLSLIGFLFRVKQRGFSTNEVIALLLLGLLLNWGRLSVVITDRSFTQFNFLIVMAIAGLLIGQSRFVKVINLGVVLSGLLIFCSIVILALLPGTLGVMFLLDPEAVEQLGGGDRFFLMNSGILFNNNAVGSVLSVMTAFFLTTETPLRRVSLGSVIVLSFLLACIVAGNATGTLMCSLLAGYYFFFMLKPRTVLIKTIRSLFGLTLVLVPLLWVLIDYDFFLYKSESGSAKIGIFIENMSLFFDSPWMWLWGGREEALYSESTLIDFLYYFGLMGLFVLLALILIGLQNNSRVRGAGGRVAIYGSRHFFVVLILLLFLQNSVWLPPVCFLFGLVLARSSYRIDYGAQTSDPVRA